MLFRENAGLIMMHSGDVHRTIKRIVDVLTPLAPHYRGWERKNFVLRLGGLNIAQEGVAIGSGFQFIDGHVESIRIDRYAAIVHNVRLWNFGNVHIGHFA